MYPLLYAPWTSSVDGYVRNINVAINIIIIIKQNPLEKFSPFNQNYTLALIIDVLWDIGVNARLSPWGPESPGSNPTIKTLYSQSLLLSTRVYLWGPGKMRTLSWFSWHVCPFNSLLTKCTGPSECLIIFKDP